MNDILQTEKRHCCYDDGSGKVKIGDYTLFVYNTAFRSSHKHCDNGSFVLYFQDQPIFIDSGRYTYSDMRWRNYFKSQLCHNVVTCHCPSDPLSPDSISKAIEDRSIDIHVTGDIGILKVYYSHADIECRVERIFLVKSSGVDISDIVFCESKKEIHQFLSLENGFRLRRKNGNQLVMTNDKIDVSIVTDYSNVDLKEGFVSHHYNEMLKAVKLHSKSIFEDSVTHNTKISCTII